MGACIAWGTCVGSAPGRVSDRRRRAGRSATQDHEGEKQGNFHLVNKTPLDSIEDPASMRVNAPSDGDFNCKGVTAEKEVAHGRGGTTRLKHR